MKNENLVMSMKRQIRGFFREAAGVVQMEYVVLGGLAVVTIVVAVMVLGVNYASRLGVLVEAAAGNTEVVEETEKEFQLQNIDNIETAVDYSKNIIGNQTGEMGHKAANLGGSIGLNLEE